jgi:hypothetical protein
MGLEIDREQFDEEDFASFSRRLDDSLRALARVLDRPGFGRGASSIGAELELDLVDVSGRPLLANVEVLSDAAEPRVTLEVDRFNLEINSSPVRITGRPFAAIGAELEQCLSVLRRAAARHGGRVAMIGILPTLEPQDLAPGVLTAGRRYRALSAGIRRLRRQDAFHVRIEGRETLEIDADDVTLEGANTSFQVHLRVEPAAFARTYNAAQIATAVALAASGNSPTFLGRDLWDETRVALFRQSVDDRSDLARDDWRASRVSFGHGWARSGAYELFAESVAFHPPLLPVLTTEDPLAIVRGGGVPALAELRLHHGTVWRWNRAVYDATEGGHLRIELRALPSGPTVIDMIANAAFLLGLTLGLAPRADDLVSRLTFGHARRNFYAAAERGLDAELLWPRDVPPSPEPRGAADLALSLVPVARLGLLNAGVNTEEANALLGVIAARVASRRTGAEWQRRMLRALRARGEGAGVERSRSRYAAMLDRYLELGEGGQPVHTWPVEP